jgi:hypothetical protein
MGADVAATARKAIDAVADTVFWAGESASEVATQLVKTATMRPKTGDHEHVRPHIRLAAVKRNGLSVRNQLDIAVAASAREMELVGPGPNIRA